MPILPIAWDDILKRFKRYDTADEARINIQAFSILSGSGAPAAGLGVNGDFYIDTDVDDLYGPKAGGAWGSATSLVGATGSTGAIGPAGPGIASKGMNIPAPLVTDEWWIWIPRDTTITEVKLGIVGGTSVEMNLVWAATLGGAETNVFSSNKIITGEQLETSGFADNTIPGNSWLRADIIAINGGVSSLLWFFRADED